MKDKEICPHCNEGILCITWDSYDGYEYLICNRCDSTYALYDDEDDLFS